VSETVTIITSLMDTIAYPARDIAELYGMRWASEMVFTQLAKRAVRPVGGGREHVADLDLAVGDYDAVDEQLGQQPALLEGGGGQPGPDALAECLKPIGDGAEFQLLPGRGIQLALIAQGWIVTDPVALAELGDIPPGEAVIEIPADVLRFAGEVR
jgi:hypothetical protein